MNLSTDGMGFTGKPKIVIDLTGKGVYATDLGNSEIGNITRIDNLVERINRVQSDGERELAKFFAELKQAKVGLAKPYAEEEPLAELLLLYKMLIIRQIQQPNN